MEQYGSYEDLWCAIEQDQEVMIKSSAIPADHAEAIGLETFRTDLTQNDGRDICRAMMEYK